MEKRNKILLLVSVVAILLVIVIYFNWDDNNDNIDVTITKLPSKEGYPLVYIKRKVWGLTGDKQIIVISNNDDKNFEPQKSSEYVYDGLFEVFYKLQHDTLFVYTLVAAVVPEKFSSPYKIVQTELNNPVLMDLIGNDNYKKKGLTKVE